MSNWRKIELLRAEADTLKGVINLLENDTQERAMLRIKSLHASLSEYVNRLEREMLEVKE